MRTWSRPPGRPPDYGLHDMAWKLPVAVLGSFDRLSYRAEWISSHLVALASARQAGDRHAEGWTLNNLGMVYSQQQHIDEAISRFEEALEIRREIGDLRGQAIPRSTSRDANLRLGRSTRGSRAAASSAFAAAGSRLPIWGGRRAHRPGGGAPGPRPPRRGHWLPAAGPRHLRRDQGTRTAKTTCCTLWPGAISNSAVRRSAIAAYQDALTIRRSVGSRHNQGLTMVFLGRRSASGGERRGSAPLLGQTHRHFR